MTAAYYVASLAAATDVSGTEIDPLFWQMGSPGKHSIQVSCSRGVALHCMVLCCIVLSDVLYYVCRRRQHHRKITNFATGTELVELNMKSVEQLK